MESSFLSELERARLNLISESKPDYEVIEITDELSKFRRKKEDGKWVFWSECRIRKNIDTVELFLFEFDKRKIWDDILEDSRILKPFSENYKVVHNIYWAPWPVVRRDFVLAIEKYKSGGVRYITSCSVNHPAAPESDRYIRGYTQYSGFILKPVDSETTHVVYICNADIKGSSSGPLEGLFQKKNTCLLKSLKYFLEG
jgi:hypothetical protein